MFDLWEPVYFRADLCLAPERESLLTRLDAAAVFSHTHTPNGGTIPALWLPEATSATGLLGGGQIVGLSAPQGGALEAEGTSAKETSNAPKETSEVGGRSSKDTGSCSCAAAATCPRPMTPTDSSPPAGNAHAQAAAPPQANRSDAPRSRLRRHEAAHESHCSEPGLGEACKAADVFVGGSCQSLPVVEARGCEASGDGTRGVQLAHGDGGDAVLAGLRSLLMVPAGPSRGSNNAWLSDSQTLPSVSAAQRGGALEAEGASAEKKETSNTPEERSDGVQDVCVNASKPSTLDDQQAARGVIARVASETDFMSSLINFVGMTGACVLCGRWEELD